MTGTMVKLTGARIARGDMVKIVGELLYPALLHEPNVGAASEDIPEGVRASCLAGGFWRATPPSIRPRVR